MTTCEGCGCCPEIGAGMSLKYYEWGISGRACPHIVRVLCDDCAERICEVIGRELERTAPKWNPQEQQ